MPVIHNMNYISDPYNKIPLVEFHSGKFQVLYLMDFWKKGFPRKFLEISFFFRLPVV